MASDVSPKHKGPIPKPGKRKKKTLTRIRRVGKVSREWLAFRKTWLAANPPDDKGEYTCGICKRPVHRLEVTLDHKIPRSRAPELRFSASNIQPSHGDCNLKKGSRIQLVDGTYYTIPKDR